MHVLIEKGVPIPSVQRPGRPFLYPYKNLGIGDSFAIPIPVEHREGRNRL